VPETEGADCVVSALSVQSLLDATTRKRLDLLLIG
jgi:hypothetical protein